jgi:hypothetical protein
MPWRPGPVRVIRAAAIARGQPAAALRRGVFAEPVARRQLQARAGQVVRANRAAPGAIPAKQFVGPVRRDLSLLPRGRGIRNPVRGGWPGHHDDRLPTTSPGPDRRAWPKARLVPNSASTSARRYRGRPASSRTSGSRPRRAQLATAADVTRNKDATCLRVIRSSPMRQPAMVAAAISRAAGRGPSAARPDGCQHCQVHQVPAVAGVS